VGSQPHLAVPNVTAHPSTSSVTITILLCCSAVLIVAIKGLIKSR